MGLRETLGTILLLFCLFRGSSAAQENCVDYKLQFERTYSVPGDVAMLNSTLVSPDVFNHTSVPYNISWYDPQTGSELGNKTGRLLVRGETLWLLNVELEDAGEYVCIVRTPSQCFRQATKLVVDHPVSGECGRPLKAEQTLTNGVNDVLSCPLKDYIKTLGSYSITSSIKWYKECTPIEDGHNFTYFDVTMLKLEGVEPQDKGSYTCTLTFTLAGVTGSVSETINARVNEKYALVPQVHEPSNEIIKAELGSSFTKRCLVFVPSVGDYPLFPYTVWTAGHQSISEDPSDRVYVESPRSWRQESPRGQWLERLLKITELREEDFSINYTCLVFGSRGIPQGYFTLVPADPNLLLPIGLVLGGVMVLFISSVVFYYIFKVDIVLWFRRAFPVLHTNTELDGKLYDAYVAYPRQSALGAGGKVEMFAFHTLSHVLERKCGYKLFIAGRDCLPGQAIMDSVEENLQASRRLLLLYTASTFTSSNSTVNNNSHNSSSTNSNNFTNSSSTNSNIKPCASTKSTSNLESSNSSDNSSSTSQSNTSDHHINTSDHHINTSDHHINTSDHHINTSDHHINTSDHHIDTSDHHINTSDHHIDTSDHNIDTSDHHIDTSDHHIDTSDHHMDTSETSKSLGRVGDGGRLEAEQHYECEAAMYRALVEGSLKVVLVELEEVTPAQLALFPESVRHLRQKQGAVCCWRSQSTGRGWRRRWRRQGDKETGGTDVALLSLSPSSRFWKEMRYHMPVRGKRSAYPEKTSLLTL
ncbi:interleukin-1 receptor type 1-like isoform 2-T3 [Polymixia lowei]